jgi:signal transduction histidine kinase
MRRLPLGRKLMIWSAVIVGLVLAIFGAATSVYLYLQEVEALDARLRAGARHFIHEFHAHGSQLAWINEEEVKEVLAPGGSPERWVEITGADGAVLYRSRNLEAQTLSHLPEGVHTVALRRDHVRACVVSASGITVRIAEDEEKIETLIHRLALAYLIVAPFALIAAGLGAWWLARQALAPVRDIASAAELVTAERLTQRLSVPPVRDEISRLAAVLNAMFDRLDMSFRQAMRFSADASHELKTPLTILRSGIEDLLRSPDLTAADQSAVAELLEQTRRLSAISESLLLLSRADAGRLYLDLHPADVSEVVAECAEDAAIMAGPRAITIETQLPATKVVARMDRGRFTQILLNLFDNAVKYNHEGGRIRVQVAEKGNAVCIAVANTGIGIAPEHGTHLFERFYRADPHAETEGHGLGLTLARELARAHGGDLLLVSASGEWTEFRFSVPTVSS